MKINFRESLAATLIVSGVVFSSCVDSDKNFYDPNYRAQNPMGNISAPNGFDWLLFSSINLNVKVNDTFNGFRCFTFARLLRMDWHQFVRTAQRTGLLIATSVLR